MTKQTNNCARIAESIIPFRDTHNRIKQMLKAKSVKCNDNKTSLTLHMKRVQKKDMNI